MRRLATTFLVLALLLGGGLTSCVAAIANAQALECCSKDCPRPPARTPNECCSVGTFAQDGEVASALELTSPDSPMFNLAMVPISAVSAPSGSSRIAILIGHGSPPPRHIR